MNSGVSIWISNIAVKPGQLYDGRNTDSSVDAWHIAGTEIKPMSSYTIYSCGGPLRGLRGAVIVADEHSNCIADICWDCASSTSSYYDNTLVDEKEHDDWRVVVPSLLRQGVPIGHAVVTLRKK